VELILKIRIASERYQKDLKIKEYYRSTKKFAVTGGRISGPVKLFLFCLKPDFTLKISLYSNLTYFG